MCRCTVATSTGSHQKPVARHSLAKCRLPQISKVDDIIIIIIKSIVIIIMSIIVIIKLSTTLFCVFWSGFKPRLCYTVCINPIKLKHMINQST